MPAPPDQSPPLVSPVRGVVVYGGALLAPETRLGWPDLLPSTLGSRRVQVLNLARRDLTSFADVVRAAGSDQRALHDRVAVVALSHVDGRSERLAPADAALFAGLAVEHLLARGAAHVLVVGPTGGGDLPGKRPATGYGAYARWLRRTDKAVSEAVLATGGASYVSLSDLPRELTRDGIHPLPAGWRWVTERVAGAVKALVSP